MSNTLVVCIDSYTSNSTIYFYLSYVYIFSKKNCNYLTKTHAEMELFLYVLVDLTKQLVVIMRYYSWP
jgi:hypothetical protein